MFGIQSTLVAAGVGVAVSGYLTVMWKTEQVKSAELQTRVEIISAELDQSEANAALLQSEVQKQNADLVRMETLAEVNQEKINELEMERDNARTETARVINEINELRAKELELARAQPYARGNLAHDRLTHSVQRIAGEKD